MTQPNPTKSQLGYMTSSQRPMCGNCTHVVEHWEDRMPRDIVTFSCGKGEFPTTKTAICFEWSSKHHKDPNILPALSVLSVCKLLVEANDTGAIEAAKSEARIALSHITRGAT